MRYPKDVEIWEHAPGRKLAQVVLKVKNEKGALAKCSQAVSDQEVNMLTGFITAPSRSPSALWSFFADFTHSKGGPAEFKERLRSLDVVESVDVLVAEDGFMVDKQHFPVQSAGRRALIMRAEALNEMLLRLWDVFGTGAATIIDQMAEAMGRHSAREIVEDFGHDFAVDQLDELLSAYTALGYAEVEVERKSSEFPFVIHARELFECEANARRAVRRRSVFFRAHIRGFMVGVFGSQFDISEVQCLTEGDDVCSFSVRVAENLVPKAAAGGVGRNSRSSPLSNL